MPDAKGRGRLPALLMFSVLLLACATGSRDERGDSMNGEIMMRGTPEVVGSGPVDRHVVLLDSSGQAIRLQGSVVAELARLSGAQVDAWGHSDGGSFSVSRYDLVSVEGEPALVGRVERAASGAVILRTEDGRQLELTGAAASLSPGAKVWVQGPEALRVERYGEIAPPDSP